MDRGINLAPARTIQSNSKKPKVDTEIEERGITLIRAPKGLSRAKQNKTNWNVQYGTITWTVEWICADSERVVSSTPESRTIEESYVLAIGKKRAQKKRKLSQHDQSAAIVANKSLKQSPESTPQKRHSEVVQQETSITGDIHFYLHHPVTISKYKCLIPMQSSQTLKDVVQGRTLLEFPTIYALYTAPGDLKEPHITLESYEAKHGTDITLNLTSHLEDGEVEDAPSMPTDVDSHKIMEVLAQDLGG